MAGPEVPDDSQETWAEKIGQVLSESGKKLYKAGEEALYDLEPRLALPGMTFEKIARARIALADAIDFINSDKELFGEKDFEIKDQNYYLAIAIKESMLEPAAKSRVAKGYFQVTQDAIDDVKKFFPDIALTMSDVYFDPNSEENQKLSLEIKEENLKEASKNNAIIGILYWHICRSHYANVAIDKSTKDSDKDRLAAFIYNFGPTRFRRLWRAIGASNFNEFEAKLASTLAENIDILTCKNPPVEIESRSYGIKFLSYVAIKKKGAIGKKKVKIGEHDYAVGALVDAMHYSAMIDGFRSQNFIPPAETKKV